MIIIRYSEIALKGKNRFFFEKRLVSNIKTCLKQNNIDFSKVTKPRGRILIHTNETCPELKNVFGISSVSHSAEFPSYDDLKKAVLEYKLPKTKSFRVSTQRIDKNFKKTSQEINSELGALVQQKTNAKVNLKNPDAVVGVEIIENKFYLYTETIAGYCGLPLGTEGKVYALIEDDASLLAAWLIMKRGCAVQAVAFKKINLDFLKKFSYGQKLELKIIKNISELKNTQTLIINQTLKTYKKLESDLLVLRPLITFTDEEISQKFAELK